MALRGAIPLLLMVLLMAAWPLSAQTYTQDSFPLELRRWEQLATTDPHAASEQLPSQWTVQTDTHTYSISTQPLRDRLTGPEPQSARLWIEQLRRQTESFRGEATRDDEKDRATLQAILARPEFKKAEEPTAWDRLSGRFRAWLQDWLTRIFAYAAQHPTGSQFLFWTLISGSVVALGAWLLHLFAQTDPLIRLPNAPALQHPLLSWQEWLAEARKAAANGDHDQAIRCAYWAAIARLQLERPMRINFSDTPRERLRFLASPSRLAAERLQPLTEITRSFERCWYAKLPAGEDDVSRTLRNLETLGCRAD